MVSYAVLSAAVNSYRYARPATAEEIREGHKRIGEWWARKQHYARLDRVFHGKKTGSFYLAPWRRSRRLRRRVSDDGA